MIPPTPAEAMTPDPRPAPRWRTVVRLAAFLAAVALVGGQAVAVLGASSAIALCRAPTGDDVRKLVVAAAIASVLLLVSGAAAAARAHGRQTPPGVVGAVGAAASLVLVCAVGLAILLALLSGSFRVPADDPDGALEKLAYLVGWVGPVAPPAALLLTLLAGRRVGPGTPATAAVLRVVGAHLVVLAAVVGLLVLSGPWRCDLIR